jgi:hypothetical protein
MTEQVPNFSELLTLDEAALAARLQAVRAAISHAGEKGRSLEHSVTEVLRAMLPAEYGLTSGFVAFHGADGPKLTPQLDVIIYDANRCGPLARLGACDILPLEAVYGYVEVKALVRASNNLDNPPRDSLEACIKTNSELSTLRERWFYESFPSSQVKIQLKKRTWLRMRGYLVAFSVSDELSSPEVLARRIADVSAHYGATTHLHGLFVVGQGFYATRAVDEGEPLHRVRYTQQHALAAFRASLLAGLSRFRRFGETASPALNQYFGVPSWDEVTPTGSGGDQS